VVDQAGNVPRPTVEGATIVLIGNFNPPIFQPGWFAVKKLLPDAEVETATNVVVTSEVGQFSADWLTVQVIPQRFQAATSDPSKFAPLLDLVLGTFTILEHTPFRIAGLNHHAHYVMPSPEKWHELGDLLAPKPCWSPLFNGRVGMRSLTVEGRRADCEAKFVRVTVAPSSDVPDGVYFAVNEHYEVEAGPDATKTLTSVIRRNWEPSGHFASNMQRHVLSQVLTA
jgi:hypothetical protein